VSSPFKEDGYRCLWRPTAGSPATAEAEHGKEISTGKTFHFMILAGLDRISAPGCGYHPGLLLYLSRYNPLSSSSARTLAGISPAYFFHQNDRSYTW